MTIVTKEICLNLQRKNRWERGLCSLCSVRKQEECNQKGDKNAYRNLYKD